MNKLERLWNDQSGATMVEYALMVAFIAIVCVAVVALFGESVRGLFTTVVATIEEFV